MRDFKKERPPNRAGNRAEELVSEFEKIRTHSKNSQIASPPPKYAFTPIPARAMRDSELSQRDWRVLSAIATRDRLGRNGQGCWAGRKHLAQYVGISESHFSDCVSRLKKAGYIEEWRDSCDQRKRIFSIRYDEKDFDFLPDGSHRRDLISEFRSRSDQNRSRSREEKVPFENAKSLKGKANSSLIYPQDNLSNIPLEKMDLNEGKITKGTGEEERFHDKPDDPRLMEKVEAWRNRTDPVARQLVETIEADKKADLRMLQKRAESLQALRERLN